VDLLATQIRRGSPEFGANRAHMERLVADLRTRIERARQGGDERSVKRHRELGKLLVRERLERLARPDSPVPRALAARADGLYDDGAPGRGARHRVGRVSGREVLVVANDATVKGGTYYPMTVKKHLRAQQVAIENRLPCLYLVDSGGRVPAAAGRGLSRPRALRRSSSTRRACRRKGIAQVAIVMGSCTAGGAYVPAMSDETIIVSGTGTIFLGGPPLVKAATGEDVTAEELGGADVHARLSGVGRLPGQRRRARAGAGATIVSTLHGSKTLPADRTTPEAPAHDPADLYGIVSADTRHPYDVREVIARLVDGSRFDEFKRLYAPTIVTGFARLHGFLVGFVANNGVLFSESALKATHFIELCNARGVPLVFLQNITGFMVGRQYERGGIAKDGAKMVHAVANSTVPKFTVVIGGSFGAGNYGMCGRAYDPRFLWMWPNARISVMGGEQAGVGAEHGQARSARPRGAHAQRG
jgi:acetyl-CoA carboxylase carboxyltransferase component